jgi:hypothetical protein
LTARRAHADDVRERQLAAAQRPLARDAEQIVHDAVELLERLIAELGRNWQRRIQSCTSSAQLRGEVEAIENGATHQLSLICTQVRESMTVLCARLVLELSRPLRQELLRSQLQVARGQTPLLNDAFEDVRVVLPASIDATFAELQLPQLGEILSPARGLFDPLFRTRAREQRECGRRLAAKLDEIARNTARELFAAAVYLSPLLLERLRGTIDELLRAHERWIDARLDEASAAAAASRARLMPVLELRAALQNEEERLRRWR